MRVGWLAWNPGYIGGAELTQAEFRAAAPDGVDVVDCPPGGVVEGLDRYVLHNLYGYTDDELPEGAIRYHHDVRQAERADPKRHIFCSPVQRERLGLEGPCVPPAVDLERFRAAAENAQERAGAVSLGAWMNPGKAPHLAAEWAAGNGGIDFYGGGACAPAGSRELAYEDVAETLARYQTFVFLPSVLEPFGRAVVEAWAAGCEIVTNRLVGARYWITEAPEAIETAAEDFWQEVLR